MRRPHPYRGQARQAATSLVPRPSYFGLRWGGADPRTIGDVHDLGDQRTSDQRINFAQSFNGLGAMIGPTIGTYFLLSDAGTTEGNILDSVKLLYIGIGSFIAMVAIAFSFVKVPKISSSLAHAENSESMTVSANQGKPKKLFRHRHFVWAAIAQFFNVAAQGGTWAFFINYGHEQMGFTDEKAGYFMTLFMGMMVLGRFVGTFLMRFIAPNKLLAAFAMGSICMCLVVAQSWGWPSFIALLMINFFLSIMFPTIFSLGLKNMGPQTSQASSFIVMGVVGGAVFPPVMGLIANHDVAQAYYLPIVCYLVIFLFGAKFYKVRK